MEKDVPMISGDDYNAILEESSLQEAADEAIQDTNELTHETASVIEETIDVINSTEEIEAAENAGLLSAIAVKAYSNRVNSYLDKLESRYIITKDDKLKPGLQFDNPQAGLLSIAETLKNAIRKVIEWAAKVVAYASNAVELLFRTVNNFIKSRASVSKTLREKVANLSSDNFYIDTEVYNNILKKNILFFSYSMADKLGDLKIKNAEAGITRLEIASLLAASKLDISNFLEVYSSLLEEFSIDKIPNIEISNNGECSIISNKNSSITGVERYFVDLLYGKQAREMPASSFRGLWLPDMLTTGENQKTTVDKNEFDYSKTRAFFASTITINNNSKGVFDKLRLVNMIAFIMFSRKDLSMSAISAVEFDFLNREKIMRENAKISVENANPVVFKSDLEKLIKDIDKASESLKGMFSNSLNRTNKLTKHISKNIDTLKKDGLKEGGGDSTIFNQELRLKLKVILQQTLAFPQFISYEINSLSSLINDGLKLIEASTKKSANIEFVSKTETSSSEKPILLLVGSQKEREEIINAELI